MVFVETVDAKVMCRFLNRLIGHLDCKIYLGVDGHLAHRSRTVLIWLANNADLKRRPPTSSKDRSRAQLAAEIRRFFRHHQRQPHAVRGYLGSPHAHYPLEENHFNF